MEHIYFEGQLCSEIAILKEKSKKAKKQKNTFGGWRWICYGFRHWNATTDAPELYQKMHRPTNKYDGISEATLS